ncbi:MAG: ABC transporter ATP-binding protein [Eubacterium sp.]
MSDNILEVKNLKRYFASVKAVDDVSFSVKRGTTMSIVGESGSGKTTLARAVTRLGETKTSGSVIFEGKDIYKLSSKELRRLRPRLQYVFQDPYSSLSPRLTVEQIISEGVLEHNIVSKNEADDYVTSIMEACGLEPSIRKRYPREFSGGQRQRICIARALAMKPEMVVCDEPVSALDVSVQAQIINLLKDLQEKYKLTYLFISHDLSVVKHISDTVGVMYMGKMVEYGSRDEIFINPLHPYTKALLESIILLKEWQ